MPSIRTRGWRAAWQAAFGLALAAVCATSALAQSVDGYVETTTSKTRETSQNGTAPEQKSDYDTLVERLSLTYTQPLWPNLRLLVGGYFERDATDGLLLGQDVDTSLVRRRPFAILRLNAQELRGELGFEQNETRTDAGQGRQADLTRNTFQGSLGWFRTGTGYVQLQASHFDEHDADRTDLDRTVKDVMLTSQYRPADWLLLEYRGILDRNHDRVKDVEYDTDSHNVRVNVGQHFFDDRVVVDSDYSTTWLTTETHSRLVGNVEQRVFPTAALAAINDFPDRDALPPNPALIDADRRVGAGINIGLPGVGGDIRRRNFGVDFGVPTKVNLIRVWVDREVRVEVANWFTWDIWTSDDNLRWTLRQTITGAPFGPFENHFDLNFEAVVSRYVKVVTRPLEPAVQFATDYPVIDITELETFDRESSQSVSGKNSTRSTLFVFDTRVRLLDTPSLFYDFNYLYNTTTTGGRRTSMINGLSYSQNFGPVWSLLARYSNERSEESRGSRNANNWSASLSATPLPTFRSSFVVSSRRENYAGDRQDSDLALATATTTLYRGVDLNGSIGRSRLTENFGRKTDSTIANIGAQITPNRIVTLNFLYQDTSRTVSGGGLENLDDPNTSFEVGASLSPLPTLYMYGSYRTERRRDLGRRNLHNYTFSWSPFPYGTLRANFSYNEYYESILDSMTRLWGPTVRWNLSGRSYLDVGYQKTTTDSTIQKLDREILFATLRIGF